MKRACLTLLLAPVFSIAIGAHTPAASTLGSWFEAYWNADTASGAAGQVKPIVDSGADFDGAFMRLKAGRTYRPEAVGVRKFDTTVNGTFLDNTLLVPEGYDPSKGWPLRVQLHGGVGRMPPQRGETPARPLADNRIPGEPQLVLQPRAWATAEWWERNQAKNVLDLVGQVKRAYNVDESRVYITGISDGGTGVYFFAMRDATPWSACLPLNGHPLVLANPDTGADGSMFVGNLVNCPMYLVNGGRDPLYPAASVAPLVDMMTKAGVSVLFHVYPEAGHNTSWWPDERAKYEDFVHGHARVANPARISWETERTDRYNRFRWLVIDKLGVRPSDVKLEDVNTFAGSTGRQLTLYSHPYVSGRVDVTRNGNSFDASTRGVQQFTLLLSPDVVDFAKPVKVTVNGRPAFEGPVKKDVSTLLKWAAKDDDRTMLYGNELKIIVP